MAGEKRRVGGMINTARGRRHSPGASPSPSPSLLPHPRPNSSHPTLCLPLSLLLSLLLSQSRAHTPRPLTTTITLPCARSAPQSPNSSTAAWRQTSHRSDPMVSLAPWWPTEYMYRILWSAYARGSSSGNTGADARHFHTSLPGHAQSVCAAPCSRPSSSFKQDILKMGP